MNQDEKEITVELLTCEHVHNHVQLSVGEEAAILDIDRALDLFDALGECLDAAGAFDDDDEGDCGVPRCH